MSANPPELVRSDEAASLWKSVLHAPSPRLAAATRDALLDHTLCLERTANELRVAIDSRELGPPWVVYESTGSEGCQRSDRNGAREHADRSVDERAREIFSDFLLCCAAL